MLPVPVLDHAVINVCDRLDEAEELWTRLGFTLTPRGHHTLGSSNHLAVLGTDYLELLGVQPGNARTDVLDWPAGLNGLVFKTHDADSTHGGLHAAGLPVLPVQAFSRPVDTPDGDTPDGDTPDGPRDAAFRTVRLEREAAPAGRVFFCQHLTPGLVWHDAWRHHANGALGIARFIIGAENPAAPASLFGRMFGADAVRLRGQGATMAAGLAQVDILAPDALQAEFGDAAPAAGGRSQWMAALALRTASLDQAERALQAGGMDHRRGPAGIVVPAPVLGGLALAFQE